MAAASPNRSRSAWRHIPNALSLVRIACAPVLLVAALIGHQSLYAGVLLPALLTDAFDGWLARSRGWQSELGSRLDSLGDQLVWIAIVTGLAVFQRETLAPYRWLVAAVIACWLVESACAWLRYGRLSSFHTRLSKAAGVLLTVYVCTLFLLGHSAALLYVAAAVSVVASLEELALLALSPEWRTDVAGLHVMLRERRLRQGTPELERRNEQ